MEIEIDIEDNKVFTQLAYILDQDALQDKIHEIRQYWHVADKLISYDDFDTWYKLHKDDFALTPDVANYWGEIPDFSFTSATTSPSLETIQKITSSNNIDLELEYLLRKNGLAASFKDMLLKAIVCGEVKMNEWVSSQFNARFHHEDSFFNIAIYEKLYSGDTKTEIKRDRCWYWENKRGKKPLQIAKEIKLKKEWIIPDDFRQTIKNAIDRYDKFLKSKGTVRSVK